jgi:hypothetical protein
VREVERQPELTHFRKQPAAERCQRPTLLGAAAVAVGMPGRTNHTDPLVSPEADLAGLPDRFGVLHQQHEPDAAFRVGLVAGPAREHPVELNSLADKLDLRALSSPTAVEIEMGECLLVCAFHRRVTQLTAVGMGARNRLHGRHDHSDLPSEPVGEAEHADPVRILEVGAGLGGTDRVGRSQIIAAVGKRAHRKIFVAVDDQQPLTSAHRVS